MLSGVPYGYRYVRKTDQVAAYYEIIEAEADVGLRVYERYTVSHMSIGAITRWLNERGVPTRKRCGRWERSSVWAMLRNPAYKGSACFGKTRIAPRQRITRPLRLHGGIAARNSANHERPREEWIEIPVPAIVSDETFALAQERLERNKVHAPRRTITPSVVQGLVSCRRCGYALSRTSTRSSARTIHYYRCLGSDAWRHLGGRVCDNRPVRQDLLDQVVWAEIIKLLETPSLIQEELDRRLAAARTSDPTQRREKALQRDLARLRKSMDRLLTAYQEDLISLDELRRRMPALRQREQATPRHATPRHARRVAVDRRSGWRSRHLSAPGRNPGRLPHPAALIRGDPRRSRAAADRAAPGRRRHDHHSPLDPDPQQSIDRRSLPAHTHRRHVHQRLLPFAFRA